MSETLPDPEASNFPEGIDDDYPERSRVPEPEEPALPSDDGYVGAAATGTTVEEQIEGENLEDKLGREVPEPTVDPLRPLDVDEERDEVGEVDDVLTADDLEVHGSLVAPDEGTHGDTEKDEVASLASGDGPSAAEETAMHIDPDS